MIKYDRFWVTMKERGITQYDLYEHYQITRSLLDRLRKNKNVEMAKYIITQNGGYAGELGATLRYLNQRYTMPDDKGKAILSDIATEELTQLSYHL